MKKQKRERVSSFKTQKVGADWTMTMVKSLTMSTMTFGSNRVFRYEDHVYQSGLITADEVKYDGQIILCVTNARIVCVQWCVQ